MLDRDQFEPRQQRPFALRSVEFVRRRQMVLAQGRAAQMPDRALGEARLLGKQRKQRFAVIDCSIKPRRPAGRVRCGDRIVIAS